MTTVGADAYGRPARWRGGQLAGLPVVYQLLHHLDRLLVAVVPLEFGRCGQYHDNGENYQHAADALVEHCQEFVCYYSL